MAIDEEAVAEAPARREHQLLERAVIGPVIVLQPLARRGLRVARNAPYAGGYVTQYYGRPVEGLHALQIEINRGLYMDETSFERSAGFEAMRALMTELVAELARLERTAFAA